MSGHNTNKFKTSPLGPIPIDWEVKDLSEIATVKRGRFSPRPRNDTRFYGGKIPFVQTGDVSNSNGRVSTFSQTLNEEGLKVSILFPKGTILITIAANIGHTAILDIDMACPDSLVGVICNNTTDNEYLNYQFQYAQKRIEHFAPGAQKNIGVDFLTTLPIVAPSFKEQRAISSTLLMWDQAIEKITQLIVAKEQRKKWLMQQLLTGKKRLKGFNEKWKRERLGDYLVKHDEKSTLNNQYPVLTSSRRGIFLQKDYYTRDVASEDNTGYNVVPRDFFTYRHMSDDLIFKFNINNIVDRGIVSTLYPVFTVKSMNRYFLWYKLNEGHEFKNYAEQQKQGGSRTYVYFSTLSELFMRLPSMEEQNAITAVIQTADKEIDLLKQKLAAYKEQKKGLMQVLLTGKKRLKI